MSADFISSTGIKIYDHADRGMYHLVDGDGEWSLNVPTDVLAAIQEYQAARADQSEENPVIDAVTTQLANIRELYSKPLSPEELQEAVRGLSVAVSALAAQTTLINAGRPDLVPVVQEAAQNAMNPRA